MTTEELRELVERMTLGESLLLLRAIVDHHFPGSEYAALSVRVREGVPDICLSVTAQYPASSPPTPSVSSLPQSRA